MPEPTPDAVNVKPNVILVIAALLAVVGVGSWKASAYVGENLRIAVENTTLHARVDELTKELDKCTARQSGWRPGTPIGVPIGSPAGSAPEPTPVGNAK